MPFPISPLYLPNTRRAIRFSDESADLYDPATKNFHDLSGFSPPASGRVGDYAFVAGADPVFEAAGPNNKRALKIDGGAYWEFLPTNPYEGANYLIFSPTGLTATSVWPYLFGEDGNANLAGGLDFRSSRIIAVSPIGNNVQVRGGMATGSVYIIMWAASQRLRQMKGSGGSPDTTAVTAAVAETANNTGDATFWQQSGGRSRQRGKFGSLNNTQPTLTASGTTYLHVFEAGEWGSDDPWGDYPDELLAFYNAKKDEYGAV